MDSTEEGAAWTPQTLLDAVNRRDAAALAACFAEDYVNETPVHPSRGFRGREQVRRNWEQIFRSVPDVRARVLRAAVDGQEIWTEWEMAGTRADAAPFLMRGVIIFGVTGPAISSARFYLEPVEDDGGDVNAAVHQVVGAASDRNAREQS